MCFFWKGVQIRRSSSEKNVLLMVNDTTHVCICLHVVQSLNRRCTQQLDKLSLAISSQYRYRSRSSACYQCDQGALLNTSSRVKVTHCRYGACQSERPMSATAMSND